MHANNHTTEESISLNLLIKEKNNLEFELNFSRQLTKLTKDLDQLKNLTPELIAIKTDEIKTKTQEVTKLITLAAPYLRAKIEQVTLHHWREENKGQTINESTAMKALTGGLHEMIKNSWDHRAPQKTIKNTIKIHIKQTTPEEVEITFSDNGQGFYEEQIGHYHCEAQQKLQSDKKGKVDYSGGKGQGVSMIARVVEGTGGHLFRSNNDTGGASLRLISSLYHAPYDYTDIQTLQHQTGDHNMSPPEIKAAKEMRKRNYEKFSALHAHEQLISLSLRRGAKPKPLLTIEAELNMLP